MFSTLISGVCSSQVVNKVDIRKTLRLADKYPIEANIDPAKWDPLKDTSPDYYLRDIKVLIIDQATGDTSEAIRRAIKTGRLPRSAKDEIAIAPIPPVLVPVMNVPNDHMVSVAQTVWATTGNHFAGPQIVFRDASNPENFEAQLKHGFDPAQGFDAIVYSINAEAASFGDGRGPINKIVKNVVQAAYLEMVNHTNWTPPVIFASAGNYGNHMDQNADPNREHGGQIFQSKVQVDPITQYVKIPGGKDGFLIPLEVGLDDNPVEITLTWTDRDEAGNDLTEDLSFATKKDLNLSVLDSVFTEIASKQTQQIGRAAITNDPDPKKNENENDFDTVGAERLRFPFLRERSDGSQEKVTLDSRERYYLRIEATKNSQAFSKNDILEVRIKGQARFVNPAAYQNSVRAPGDSRYVFTTGNTLPLSSQGTFPGHIAKPNTNLNETLIPIFGNGAREEGTSHLGAPLSAGIYINLLQRLRHEKLAEGILLETLVEYCRRLPRNGKMAPEFVLPELKTIVALDKITREKVKAAYAKFAPLRQAALEQAENAKLRKSAQDRTGDDEEALRNLEKDDATATKK